MWVSLPHTLADISNQGLPPTQSQLFHMYQQTTGWEGPKKETVVPEPNSHLAQTGSMEGDAYLVGVKDGDEDDARMLPEREVRIA